jgi:hypothetical protein
MSESGPRSEEDRDTEWLVGEEGGSDGRRG